MAPAPPAGFRAGRQLRLVNETQLDARFIEFVEEDNGVAHVSGQAVEGDGVQAVDAAEVDDLAEAAHRRPVEGRAGIALVVKTLAGPVKARFAHGPGLYRIIV
jgi:hypothetical protein